ncbi:hypothetical protein FXO38_33223 [Capsicum annuum]|nr:hypothetical protein FXO38_33223 [Capsicum annuum]
MRISTCFSFNEHVCLRAFEMILFCSHPSNFVLIDFLVLHGPGPGGPESNISPSVVQANCFQVAANSFMSCRCNCAVQPDCSVEKHNFIGEPLDTTRIEQSGVSGCIKNLFDCKLNDSQKVPLDNMVSLEGNSDLMRNKINKMECHSSQWRDVPKKVARAVTLLSQKYPVFLLEDRVSAPVVTEASALIHDNEFSTANCQKTLASNVVVDEGSGINRCWSSNDAQGSKQSTVFLGIACKFNPMDAGPSKGFADNSACSLIDELRLRDSLKLKKMQNQSSFNIQEKSHRIQKVADFSKKVTRKRTKWRKLDTTLPAVCSACAYPEGTCGSGLQHSGNDKKGALLTDNGSAEKCVYSIEPSFRERRARMRSLSTLSCNGKVNYHDAKAFGTRANLLMMTIPLQPVNYQEERVGNWILQCLLGRQMRDISALSELDPRQSLEQSKRAHCHGGEQGTHLFHSLEKRWSVCLIEAGNIADDSLPTSQKPKSKGIHKRGLNELTLQGIHPGGGSTCARTEGYKGLKKEGVRYNSPQYSESDGGCFVAQEQLNAWIHITGQNPSRQEILRLPPKDAEYDYRKEYARYKHSNRWKSLIVYKSGIHALGFYMSRFISQGEMVSSVSTLFL